ncbi:MAG: ZIP family metal transporter [Actinomycetia bacterium]|nr:ZIP family metal transporter [Actinomycetes bacterium]
MYELLGLKLLAVVLIFGAGLLGGLIPWRVARTPRSDVYLGWGNAFSGGVLLAAGLIHLLGDAVDGFADLWPTVDYPWAFTTAAVAFLIILGIERVVPSVSRVPAGSAALGSDPESDSIVQAAQETKRYPYLLLVTLSIHSIIAGMALGAQSTFAGLLVILMAVAAHKSAAGFALGVSLHRVGTDPSRARAIVAGFSLMTPLGIVLGTGISALLDSTGEQMFEALFDAIAAGTFLYIASMDIIREEFIPARDDRRIRWVWAAAGLTLMAVVAVWV